MGGYGSGRPTIHETVEDSLKRALAAPSTRSALDPRARRSGSWHWSTNGGEIASVGYDWAGPDALLTLRYKHKDEPITQMIRLVCTIPQFGGERWWFVCPFTDRRVRALFLPPGARRWGSRQAYRLTYQSQRESDFGMSILRKMAGAGSRTSRDLIAEAALSRGDPFGLKEERRWEKRLKAWRRRNEIRRIAKRQRAAARVPDRNLTG